MQKMAFTFGSLNIFIRSEARSRSEPARNPQRLRTFGASLGLNPNFSRTATERSIAFGSGGGLAGAMIPIVSPELSRGGLVGTLGLLPLFHAFSQL
jgi:hypothetical protein